MPPSQAAQQPLIVCPKCKTQPTWDGGRQGWGQGPFRVGGCTFATGQGTGGVYACKKCNHRWKEKEDTDNEWRAEMKRLRAGATAAPASSAADGAAATFTWQGNNNGFGTVAAGKPSLLQQEHIRAGDAALVAPPYCVHSELCEVAEGDEIGNPVMMERQKWAINMAKDRSLLPADALGVGVYSSHPNDNNGFTWQGNAGLIAQDDALRAAVA